MCLILTINTLTYKKVFRMSEITILVFASKQFLLFWAKNLDFHEIPKFVTMSRNFPLWFRISFIFMKIFVRYHIFLSPNFSSLEYKLRDLPSVMKMVQESRGPGVGELAWRENKKIKKLLSMVGRNFFIFLFSLQTRVFLYQITSYK